MISDLIIEPPPLIAPNAQSPLAIPTGCREIPKDKYLFYPSVPKDLQANKDFREETWRKAAEDPLRASKEIEKCKRDLLYFVNTYCHVIEPRELDPETRIKPFITWPFQDGMFYEIEDSIGRHPLYMDKSRDMAVSWDVLTTYFHQWLFSKNCIFRVGSAVGKLVDDPEVEDTLFSKLDVLFDYLPEFMRPDPFDEKEWGRHKKKFLRKNRVNGSVIIGEATVDEFARGGRCLSLFLDEWAHFGTMDVAVSSAISESSKSKIYGTTPNGTGNEAHRMSEDQYIRKLRFHWSVHPEKAVGLSLTDKNELTSPWYVAKCRELSLPHIIASQLDCSYTASGTIVYGPEILAKQIREYVSDPLVCGELLYDSQSGYPQGFLPCLGGKIKLWLPLDTKNNLPKDDYVIGADIAAGSGASASAFSVGSRTTKKKVAEFIYNKIEPREFATLTVAFARWINGISGSGLGGAFIKFEANGTGGYSFANQIIGLNYSNVYYRQDENNYRRQATLRPGWHSTLPAKNSLILDHAMAMATDALKEPSRACIEECRKIKVDQRGAFVHELSMNIGTHTHRRTTRPGTGDQNHGDIVIATALMWSCMKDFYSQEMAPNSAIKVNSLAHRRVQARREMAEAAHRKEYPHGMY